MAHRTPFQSAAGRSRERPALGDSPNADSDGPSYLMARIAHQTGLPRVQREAWYGHNPRTHGPSKNRRDVLDILWFDDGLTAKADHSGESAAACHGDLGEIEIRSSWATSDAVHLVYKGGRMIGGHDDPYIGAFTLWRDGWLVTGPGEPGVTKRTATASTLLIDGHGQHHDGVKTNDAVPEPPPGSSQHVNNARLVGYFDNHADNSAGGYPIDLVSAVTSFDQLYRVDSTDGLRAASLSNTTFTSVETAGRPTLQGLRRYLIWVEGKAIFVADQWRTTATGQGAPYRFDWQLTSNQYLVDYPKAGEAVGDGILDPNRCSTRIGRMPATGYCSRAVGPRTAWRSTNASTSR